MVILWTLVTLSTQKLIPWPRPTVSTPIFQPTFCPLSWQMSWLMTACDNSGKFCWPQFKYAENVSRCSQWILFASSRVIKRTWLYKTYLGKDYEVLENYRYLKIVEVAWTAINCLSASTPHSTKLQKVRFPYSVVCPKTRLCSYRQPL